MFIDCDGILNLFVVTNLPLPAGCASGGGSGPVRQGR